MAILPPADESAIAACPTPLPQTLGEPEPLGPPAPPPRVAIVGAGVAGLALALRLGEGGRYRPLLIEREARPGGLARCLHFKGVSTDMGPHRIHTEIPEVAALIERIAAPSLFTVRRSSHIYLRGHFLRYPPAPLEMTRRLGPLNMLRFAAGFGLERLRPAPQPETYESLMRRAFGGPLYDFLLRPYSEKTWKTDPAELHADTARVRVSAGSLAKMMAGVFRRREQPGGETALKQFRYVRGGAETLVQHLWEHARAGGAELLTGRGVARFQLDERLRIVAAELAAGEDGRAAGGGNGDPAGGNGHASPESRLSAEMFASTIPLPLLLGDLLPAAEELAAAREAAAGLRYLDMIFVALIVRRKVISGDNWLYFPEPHLIFNRAYEAKNFDPTMGPEDKSVLCLEITLRRNDPLWREDDGALIREATRQVAGTGLFRADEVEEGFVHRLAYAYPIYSLDYDRRLERVFNGLARIPNLMTLGRQGLFNHNNMDHSIWMGLRAANLLNEFAPEQAVAQWYARVDEFKRMRIVD